MGKKNAITLIIVIILGLCTLYITNIYQTAMGEKSHGQAEAISVAKEKGGMSTVKFAETFNGLTQYQVVSGVNSKNEPILVWVHSDKKEKLIIRKQTEGISKDKAIAVSEKQSKPRKLISAQLGVAENIPCWEIKYIDQYDRYTYEYVDFVKGNIIKQIAIK
ncbi:DUF5590 domain-containing protein [Metabacillus sp. RGM 3146]|uniref:cell wall elongation regulator TseB-like domain-containing protein n=1 Tax=Metabacillus sp. RGM 3146 TaxID=3401092 RepID=UPI003B9C84F7